MPILSPVTDNLLFFKSAEEGKSFPLNSRIDRGSAACEADTLPTKLPHLVFATDEKDPEFLTCLLYPDKALLCNESGPRLCLNHPCMSCLSFEALGQHFHSKLKIESVACMCLQVEFCPQISSVNVGTASSVQQSTY